MSEAFLYDLVPVTRFPLARMSPAIVVLTWALFLVPAGLVATGFVADEAGLLIVGGSVLLLYIAVWFVFRPTRFEVSGEGLRIVWPVRSRFIPRSSIVDARRVPISEFRRQYGAGIRIGAGGLWGGFGLLKTRRLTFSFWISHLKEFVIVELRDARPLLITPQDPERFIRAVADVMERG